MRLPDGSFDPFLYGGAIGWLAIAALLTALLAADIRRRPIERAPAAPWKYVVGALVASSLLAVLLTAFVGAAPTDMPWQLLAFALGIGATSGIVLATLSARQRTSLDAAREAMRG